MNLMTLDKRDAAFHRNIKFSKMAAFREGYQKVELFIMLLQLQCSFWLNSMCSDRIICANSRNSNILTRNKLLKDPTLKFGSIFGDYYWCKELVFGVFYPACQSIKYTTEGVVV